MLSCTNFTEPILEYFDPFHPPSLHKMNNLVVNNWSDYNILLPDSLPVHDMRTDLVVHLPVSRVYPSIYQSQGYVPESNIENDRKKYEQIFTF